MPTVNCQRRSVSWHAKATADSGRILSTLAYTSNASKVQICIQFALAFRTVRWERCRMAQSRGFGSALMPNMTGW
jgi:hypothetical protein